MEDIIFCGLNLGAWVTIVTVLSMFATLLLTKLREDIAFLGVIAILLLTGVLDTKEALSGFSSGSVVVIGVLFAVLAGAYGRVAMDCPLLAGNTEELFGSSGQADVACCSTQFYIEQHNGGGTLCRHREGMGKETAHGTF